MEIRMESPADIARAAAEFAAAMGGRTVFAFYGAMGAGKTTFIKAVCRALGVEDNVTSPTFAIVNEYRDTSGGAVYHFDFYRVTRLAEALDMGCGEYFDSGRPCFIEWPELVETLLPPGAARVTLEELPGGARRLTLV